MSSPILAKKKRKSRTSTNFIHKKSFRSNLINHSDAGLGVKPKFWELKGLLGIAGLDLIRFCLRFYGHYLIFFRFRSFMLTGFRKNGSTESVSLPSRRFSWDVFFFKPFRSWSISVVIWVCSLDISSCAAFLSTLKNTFPELSHRLFKAGYFRNKSWFEFEISKNAIRNEK